MLLVVTDHVVDLRVRAPFRWPRHPGSRLHALLKAALDRVDPLIRARLLAPVVPDPPLHFCLRAGDTAPAALFPVLPCTGTRPRGTLEPGERLQIRLRRLGHPDACTDQTIDDALEHLDEALVAEQIGRRERVLEVDENPTADTRVSLQFITPGHIESSDQVRVDIGFRSLIGLIRRRLEVICALYGELPAGVSRRFRDESLQLADQVLCVRSRLRREEWDRESSRPDGTHTRHRMVGLLGDIEFEGPLGPFVPTLQAIQEIHAGKLTSMGLGRIAVVLSPRPGPGLPHDALSDNHIAEHD